MFVELLYHKNALFAILCDDLTKNPRPVYRSSHRKFTKTQIKDLGIALSCAFSVLFFVDELGYS